MQNSSLTILGSGSALPTRSSFPAAYLLEMRDKQYLIDCGEGTQIRMRQMALKTNRLSQVFISHLHGDHCFGLIGLISSLAMMGRNADLHIHAPQELEKLLRPMLDFFCEGNPFEVIFHTVDTKKHCLVFEDRSVSVFSIPLKHRVPCCGYLFEEKHRERHIIRDMIDFYKIPVSQIHKIKQGANFLTADGETIPNERLTTPPMPPKRFAYCSDTAYSEKIIPYIKGVDLLFHEATFLDDDHDRARETKHSTAREAAEIAKHAKIQKLLIGHFSARYNNKKMLLEEAKKIFPNTSLAEDMQVFMF